MSGGRNQRSPEARAWAHLYKGKAWALLRQATLVRDLYRCQTLGCGVMLKGRHPEADSPVVNHKTPHKGDERLFFDPGNTEAVCKACHDGVVQSSERTGRPVTVIGPDGWPVTT